MTNALLTNCVVLFIKLVLVCAVGDSVCRRKVIYVFNPKRHYQVSFTLVIHTHGVQPSYSSAKLSKFVASFIIQFTYKIICNSLFFYIKKCYTIKKIHIKLKYSNAYIKKKLQLEII